jgi:hypothetical protein
LQALIIQGLFFFHCAPARQKDIHADENELLKKRRGLEKAAMASDGLVSERHAGVSSPNFT